MTWHAFEQLLRRKRPRYYVTQVTAPTLTNDMYGAFLARSLGARTIAFGTHVTPMPLQTMAAFPTLDFVLRGEPELTLRELIDTLEWERRETGARGQRAARSRALGAPEQDVPRNRPRPGARPGLESKITQIAPCSGTGRIVIQNPKSKIQNELTRATNCADQGLVWRDPTVKWSSTPTAPSSATSTTCPSRLHHLLPWDSYRAPGMEGPYTFVVTSRGCPAGCRFCIKHVSYGSTVRIRSPENVLDELQAACGTWACTTSTCTPTSSPSTASRSWASARA